MKAFIGKEWESVVLDDLLQTIQNQESKRYTWPPEPVEVTQILHLNGRRQSVTYRKRVPYVKTHSLPSVWPTSPLPWSSEQN